MGEVSFGGTSLDREVPAALPGDRALKLFSARTRWPFKDARFLHTRPLPRRRQLPASAPAEGHT